MARNKRRGRPISGILVLDKPPKASSNEALQEVKRLYYAAKAGHTGSLDPLATGLLPLCFGEATKFSQYLLESDKTYISTFVFGAESTTGDADGELTEVSGAQSLDAKTVERALQEFEGEQEQLPPMYSALKHNGERLYELARKGEVVERQPRRVYIERAELLDFRAGDRPEAEVLLQVSKGTYIRSIASDLGEQLETAAYVGSLRRTQVGPFLESDLVDMEQLRSLKAGEKFAEMDGLLLPIDSALEHLQAVELDESSAFYLQRGQAVRIADAPGAGYVRLQRSCGDFVGVGEIVDDGRVAPRRLVVNR